MAGTVEEVEIDERLVKDCRAVYAYAFGREGFLVPRKEIVCRSAAVLLLEGFPDKAAYLARLGNNEDLEHQPLWCSLCERRPTGR